ncbi:MAG: precorrin-2 dehydrogenase/sirohydrochlorin ferrochelatase family protein [Euzebya sp.]
MYLPLMLELDGQRIVCVGAGPAARRKVVPLHDCGAHLIIIAPQVDPAVAEVARTVHQRPYRAGDLDGGRPIRLVVAATGRPQVDQQVHDDAAERGIWCLRVDGKGDAAVPAIIRRSGIVAAMTTGVPVLTQRLRQALELVIDHRWEDASQHLTSLRRDPAVRTALAAVDADERRARWHRAVDLMLADDAFGDGTTPAQILMGEV